MKPHHVFLGLLIATGVVAGLTALAMASLASHVEDDLPPAGQYRIVLDREVPEFAFVDQYEREGSLQGLQGQVAFVQLVFVDCATSCPLMTSNFRRFQQEIEGTAGIQLVSVTVNPKHDTPQRLLKYARDYGAELDNWTFARGSERDVRKLRGALEGMSGLPYSEHSAKTYLIAPDGRHKRFYDIRHAAEREMMLADARTLLRGESLE